MRWQIVALLVLTGLAMAGLGLWYFRSDSELTFEGRPPRAWVVDLKSNEIPKRNRSQTALTNLGLAMGLWNFQVETTNDENKRQKAITELNRYRPVVKEIMPDLIAMLREPDPELRVVVAHVVGFFGVEAEAAVPALIAGLKDDHQESLHAMIRALGSIGPVANAAVPALIGIIKDKESKSTKQVVAVALGKMGPAAKEAVPALILQLKDQSRQLCAYTAEALGKMGPAAKEAVPALILLLKDQETLVRTKAAEALQEIDPVAAKNAGVK